MSPPALCVRDRRRASDGRLAVVRYITNGAVSYKVGAQWGSLPVAEFLAEFPEEAHRYTPLPSESTRRVPKQSTLRYRMAALQKELAETVAEMKRRAKGWKKSARDPKSPPEIRARKERISVIYAELADFAEQRMFREFSDEEAE